MKFSTLSMVIVLIHHLSFRLLFGVSIAHLLTLTTGMKFSWQVVAWVVVALHTLAEVLGEQRKKD